MNAIKKHEPDPMSRNNTDRLRKRVPMLPVLALTAAVAVTPLVANRIAYDKQKEHLRGASMEAVLRPGAEQLAVKVVTAVHLHPTDKPGVEAQEPLTSIYDATDDDGNVVGRTAYLRSTNRFTGDTYNVYVTSSNTSGDPDPTDVTNINMWTGNKYESYEISNDGDGWSSRSITGVSTDPDIARLDIEGAGRVVDTAIDNLQRVN